VPMEYPLQTATRAVVTFHEKVRYLLQLAKGLGPHGPNGPDDVFREVPDAKLHVPLSQVVYVGDGKSDMPAFALMQEHGGIALGVVDADRVHDWDGYSSERGERRVQNLAPADYSEGSELLRSLELAVESMAKLAALRKLGAGE
jgi:hypothetical protein